MDARLLFLYFMIGGGVVAATTFFGIQAKSQLAAFIAFLPSVSVITLCTIYFGGGMQTAVSYAKSMLLLLPPWVLYVIVLILLLPRIGLVGSLVAGMATYLGIALLIMKLT